jgi:hypothetical protein
MTVLSILAVRSTRMLMSGGRPLIGDTLRGIRLDTGEKGRL